MKLLLEEEVSLVAVMLLVLLIHLGNILGIIMKMNKKNYGWLYMMVYYFVGEPSRTLVSWRMWHRASIN